MAFPHKNQVTKMEALVKKKCCFSVHVVVCHQDAKCVAVVAAQQNFSDKKKQKKHPSFWVTKLKVDDNVWLRDSYCFHSHSRSDL